MTRSLKTSFAAKAGAVFTVATMALGAAATPAGPDEHTRELLTKDKTCVKAGNLQDVPVWQPVEAYVATLAKKAQLVIEPEDRDVEICLGPEVSGDRVGAYDWESMKLSLVFPSSASVDVQPRQEEDIVNTLRHEWRHRRQHKAGFIDMTNDPSIPARDRERLYLALEADARVEAVVFAARMRREGHPEYVAGMRKGLNAGPMYMFDQAMKKKPDEMAARRAAFAEVFNSDSQMWYYCGRPLVGTPKSIREHSPKGVISPAMSDKTLTALGSRPGERSYMDKSLMKMIRGGC